jgi:hypothetical protein
VRCPLCGVVRACDAGGGGGAGDGDGAGAFSDLYRHRRLLLGQRLRWALGAGLRRRLAIDARSLRLASSPQDAARAAGGPEGGTLQARSPLERSSRCAPLPRPCPGGGGNTARARRTPSRPRRTRSGLRISNRSRSLARSCSRSRRRRSPSSRPPCAPSAPPAAPPPPPPRPRQQRQPTAQPVTCRLPGPAGRHALKRAMRGRGRRSQRRTTTRRRCRRCTGEAGLRLADAAAGCGCGGCVLA